MFFLYGRVKIIHCPQWKEYELPKTIKAYDGLDGGLIIAYVLILI